MEATPPARQSQSRRGVHAHANCHESRKDREIPGHAADGGADLKDEQHSRQEQPTPPRLVGAPASQRRQSPDRLARVPWPNREPMGKPTKVIGQPQLMQFLRQSKFDIAQSTELK